MDYGGIDKRRTKKDLKRKRLARGYKRGGQFRTQNVNEVGEEETDNKKAKKIKKKNRKY
ncbi:MAG: hypothetical protein KKF50_04620 [Nanoarchaeota archaeon]|nr:hypothetical protein [Nanoarchaeota archaeon]